MKNKGDAKDWPSYILMYFLYSNEIYDNVKSAKSYLARAFERDADKESLKRNLHIKVDDHEVIQKLVKLGMKLE